MPSATKNTPSLWAQINTVLLVSFLAILIWLLAESRMVQTRIVELQIVLVGNSQDPEHIFVVRPLPSQSWSSSIEVELEGSLASLDQASRELRGRVLLLVGDHIPSRIGDHDLDLHATLRDLPALRTHGVSIRSLSKDLARVQVDQIISLDLPVRFDLSSSVALDGPPRAIPQSITVQGPSTLLNTLQGREVLAAPTPESIAALIPGRLETIPGVGFTLPVSLDSTSSPGWAPTFTPPRVDIRLTIRSLTQTTIIERLPIQILLAPGEVGRWIVALNPGSEDLVSIQLSGPTDALTAINDGSITPQAFISLSFQDLERSISTKQVQLLGLPSSVHILSTLPEVGFSITKAPLPPVDTPATTP